MKHDWWFARDTFSTGGYSQLFPTTSAGGATEEERTLKSAEKLTITIENALVLEDKDGWPKGDNDLVIATKHKIGTKPTVDRLHFLKRDVPSPHWERFTWQPVVYSTNDFTPEDEEIKLQVRVYDEDGLDQDEADQITAALSAAASSAAIAFPAFAPFAGLASGLGQGLVKLIEPLTEIPSHLSA